MKRKLISLFLISCSILFAGCSNKIVINNAFEYLVQPEDFVYGYFGMSGEASIETYSYQSIFVGEYSKEVTAYVTQAGLNAGYKFVSWSDGNTNPTRKDLAKAENGNGPIVFYANFAKE